MIAQFGRFNNVLESEKLCHYVKDEVSHSKLNFTKTTLLKPYKTQNTAVTAVFIKRVQSGLEKR